MSDDRGTTSTTKIVNAGIKRAKALSDLMAREARIVVLLAIGTFFAKYSDPIAQYIALPALSPVIFKAALVSMGMGLARLLVRLYFPWLNLGALVEKSKESAIAVGIVAAAFVYLMAEMFKYVVVN